MLAGGAVAPPGIAPHAVDGELLWIVVDLSEDIHHVLGDGGVDGDGQGGAHLAAVAGELPHREGDGGHGGGRLLLAVKAALVLTAEEEEIFAGVLIGILEPEVLEEVVLCGGLPPVHLLPELLLLDLGLGHGLKQQGVLVAGRADTVIGGHIIVISHAAGVGGRGDAVSHSGGGPLVGEDSRAGGAVHKVEGHGLLLSVVLLVHLVQHPHQEGGGVSPLEGVGIAEGTVSLALDYARLGQGGHGLLAGGVHLVPVREGRGVGSRLGGAEPEIPDGMAGRGPLGQDPSQQQGGVLAGDRVAEGAPVGDRQTILWQQEPAGQGRLEPRLIPAQAGGQGVFIGPRGEGPVQHDQELSPAQGAGGVDAAVAGPLEDAQAGGLGHGVIGPVGAGQVGVPGRQSRDGQGEAQGPGQDQGADAFAKVHVSFSPSLYGCPQGVPAGPEGEPSPNSSGSRPAPFICSIIRTPQYLKIKPDILSKNGEAPVTLFPSRHRNGQKKPAAFAAGSGRWGITGLRWSPLPSCVRSAFSGGYRPPAPPE